MVIKKSILLLFIIFSITIFITGQDIDSILNEYDYLRLKSESLEGEGNYRKAFQFYKQYDILRDSLISRQYEARLAAMGKLVDEERNMHEATIRQAETNKLNSDRQRNELGIIILVIVFPVFIILLILLFRQYRNKLMAEKLLKQQKTAAGRYNGTLEKLNKEISDNYLYADLIQSAVLSSHAQFQENFSEHFIYFKPKYQVSGDFYWTCRQGKKTFVAVADCTGHDVQGALISMLGITYLNDIVNRLHLEYTDEILNQLKDMLYLKLSQDYEGLEAKDGIDIALCVIDQQKMELQFSGAFNPLFIISNNNLEILRGDRIPISFSTKDNVYFSRHNFSLSEGDIIYLLSDGYYDQFGGEGRKKFTTKRFSHLLLDIYQFPMEKQKEWLDKTITDWMGKNEQVDDITIVGVKI